jgi:DHA1 family inner membrane transport protein
VLSTLGEFGRRIERRLIGGFPEFIRVNLRIEALAAIAFGVFYAGAIAFLPVVLRRLGATPDMLALYIAQNYLGSVFASFSVMLMRGRRPKSFAITFWILGRSLFLAMAFVGQPGWLLVITGLFWLFEAFPGPAYTQIMQKIYPNPYRGRALGIVRVAMLLSMLAATPLAGWAFDRYGHQVVLPLAGLFGVCSTLLFTRVRTDNEIYQPPVDRALGGIWGILMRDRRFALYMLGFSLYGLGFLVGYPFFAIVQVDRLQLSYTTIGYLALVQSLCWLMGNIFWGRLVDQRGGAWVLRVNVGIALIIPLSYMLAGNVWMLIPAFIVHGIISAGIDLGIISAGIELADPERIAEYSALQATIIGIRGMIGPFLGAALVGAGMANQLVFGLGIVLIGLGWLVLGLVVAQARQAAELPRAEA